MPLLTRLSPLMALNFPLEPLNFDAKTCWQISPDFLRERQTAKAKQAACSQMTSEVTHLYSVNIFLQNFMPFLLKSQIAKGYLHQVPTQSSRSLPAYSLHLISGPFGLRSPNTPVRLTSELSRSFFVNKKIMNCCNISCFSSGSVKCMHPHHHRHG